MSTTKKEKIGETFISSQGEVIRVVEYFNPQNCTIIFNEKDIFYNKVYGNVKKGSVKNPNYPNIFNIGFIGDGIYKSRYKGKLTKEYSSWKNMLSRCYDGKNPTYRDITICDEWKCFQNFAKWSYENYKSHMEKWNLDKDILIKENKVYSPKTCCFVPHEINMLFVKSEKTRGNLPIGVTKNHKRYQATIGIDRGRVNLGTYGTPKEAFQAYKIGKEEYIKEIADKWKPQITRETYQALINHRVQITD
jgi:hypothetical protein